MLNIPRHQIKSSIEGVYAEYDDAVKNLQSKRNEVSELDAVLDGLKKEISSLHSSKEVFVAGLDEREKEVLSSEDEIKSKKENLLLFEKKIQSNVSDLEKELDGLKQQKKEVLRVLKEQCDCIEKNKNQVTSLKYEAERLTDNSNILKDVIAKQEQRLDFLNKQIEGASVIFVNENKKINDIITLRERCQTWSEKLKIREDFVRDQFVQLGLPYKQ